MEIGEVRRDFEREVLEVKSLEQLESLRIKYLGKKGIINELFKKLKELPPEEKPIFGKEVNSLRDFIKNLLEEKKKEIGSGKKRERIDLTLPGRFYSGGSIHPLSLIEDEIVDIFVGMGFSVVYGNEVETDYYNFTALNTPEDHPARDLHDTFYLKDGRLLRTHTSPVQIRVMEKKKPPLRIIAPGRVYRVDAFDPSHSPVFHQIEGLYVDRDVTLGDLFGTLEEFAKRVFSPDTEAMFIPSFFPFTEPSAEMKISCPFCGGEGCGVCQYTGWVEILGCGMVHRKILENLGYGDYTGFAFGMGVERIAMLKMGINDIRLFYENDLEFLEQFK